MPSGRRILLRSRRKLLQDELIVLIDEKRHRMAYHDSDREPSGLVLPEELFEPIDRHFAHFIMQLSGSCNGMLLIAAALLSRSSREGHTCLDLAKTSGLMSWGEQGEMMLPDGRAWMEALRSEFVVGEPGQYRPLILDDYGRLYLHRSHENEQVLAKILLTLNKQILPFDKGLLHEGISRMFPEVAADGEEWQKAAAVTAVSRGLCVITGGPGTGKTTVVSKILALLLEQDQNLKISIAAPTGKAAQRIMEAIKSSLDKIDCATTVKAKIPLEAFTIHRLLGISSLSSRPVFSSAIRLRADVVVVDEASMVDLALMSYLARALKDGARMILLGDKNQLASVEAGYVLGDICDAGERQGYSPAMAALLAETAGCSVSAHGEGGMQDSVVELTKTYRFSEESLIFALSTAINAGEVKQSLQILRSSSSSELVSRDLPRPEELHRLAKDAVIEGYGPYLKTSDVKERFRLLDEFRVLCPVREGPYGVKAMNRLVEEILRDAGLLESEKLHYHGRPVIILENDYTLKLFNGDIGLILLEEGEMKAFFRDTAGDVRKIATARLPRHETAFALTVHKSQGSEFDRVLLVLPDRDSPILTRELVYTAITRAKSAIEIWSNDSVFAAAAARRTERSSGLNNLIWEP
jgi:exodeoxyribonuclease V alpha subunit